MADIFKEIMDNSTSGQLTDELRISPRKMYINAKERISFVRDRKFYNQMPKFNELEPGDWLLCYGACTGYEFNGKTWELEALINPEDDGRNIVIFSHINNVPVTDINYTILSAEPKVLNVPKSLKDAICEKNPNMTLNEYLYTDSVKFNIIDEKIQCDTNEEKSDLSNFFNEELEEKNNSSNANSFFNYSSDANTELGLDFFED